MRYFFMMLVFGLFLNGEILEIFNRTKDVPVFIKSKGYIGFVDNKCASAVVVEKKGSDRKTAHFLEEGYTKRSVYEDNSSLWIPNGEVKIKLYESPKQYRYPKHLGAYFNLNDCVTTDMENYTCKIFNDKLLGDFILNKLEIEKKENIKINIVYFRLFK